MDEQTRSIVRGCAIGCGAALALITVLGTLGVLRVVRTFQSAADAQDELAVQPGTAEEFTPAADGSIPDERIEAFLTVRRGLAGACDRFAANTAAMVQLDTLDREETPRRIEILRAAGRATRGAMRVAPSMGELFEQRNRLLLEAGMGLDEYSYLYVVAYHEQLTGERPRTGILTGSPINRRIHGVLADMIARQLETARAAGLPDGRVAALEREHAALVADEARIPWQEGLPDDLRRSLAPFREVLDASFCGAATELELLRLRHSFVLETE